MSATVLAVTGSAQAASTPVRIDAGSTTSYTDANGNTWLADEFFTAGSTASNTNTITGSPAPAVFQTERWGTFAYNIPVANGNYNVNLDFAETTVTGPGLRIFDVSINGTQVLTNFDIYATAGGINIAVVKTFPVTVTNGTLNINFPVGSVRGPLINGIEVLPATTSSSLRIDAGSTTSYTDANGNTWLADEFFTAGSTASNTNTITGSPAPAVFQTERWGTFAYNIPVANGNYNVNLDFAETTVTGPGLRIFDVSINGTQVLTNFDIYATAGGINIAVVKTFPVTVTNGTLNINFPAGSVRGPLVNGIEVLPATIVLGPPTITTPPASRTVTAGQTATFTVVAAGTAPLGYQWLKNGANISGATSASYTTPATATTDSGTTFDVVVSNTAGSVTSSAATLTVTAAAVAPTITTQPANQTVTAGQTATFAVVAGGTAPLSYQWQKNGANISGATGTSYTTPATATTDSGTTFDVVVSNTAGSVTSTTATLTVTAAAVAPTITTPPASKTVTIGQTATFTVVAAGTAPLGYQWQKNGANISGGTSASYTTPATATTDSGSTFRVVVSNTAGTATSAAATLTVNPAPAPAIQVSSTSISFGNDVVGSNSSQLLVITNTGAATLTITQVNETGSAFSVSGYTLPLSVNAGNQTTIAVAFLPTSVGAASGNISVVSNAPTSPTSVGLSGTGIAATFTLGISPASLSFGNVTTNTSSATQNVTLTNTGNSKVTISQITLSGSGYSMTGGSAPVTLTPSQNLILTNQFSPTVAGSVSGSLSMVSNASGSPAAVPLSGTGVVPVQHSVALTWTASTSTISGYNVYRGAVSGGPYTKINSSPVAILTYSDSTVLSGSTYYYVTTAVDSSGDESVYSNAASAPIP